MSKENMSKKNILDYDEEKNNPSTELHAYSYEGIL